MLGLFIRIGIGGLTDMSEEELYWAHWWYFMEHCEFQFGVTEINALACYHDQNTCGECAWEICPRITEMEITIEDPFGQAVRVR